jgi:predicted small lipoprotein YifL
MPRRFVAILCLALLGLALAGCTKCGPIWNDWGPRACHADAPRG